MAPITLGQFQNTLAAAAAQRGRDYTAVHAVTVRWEKDDTKAMQDSDHFQKMLKTLEVAPATEHVIRHSDSSPGIAFQRTLLDLIEKSKAKTEKEHNLMIFHYAGHGMIKNGMIKNGMIKNGSFTFAETRTVSRFINAENWLLNTVKDSSMISDSDHLDVLLILDCCYAHVATRATAIPRRVVEVIAATSVQTPAARSAPHNTFTAKLAGEIARRKRSGHKHVEFADVFQSIRSRGDKVQPNHSILVGVASVILPLNGPRNVDPTSIPPSYTALFSVNVSQDLTADEMRQLSAWMRSLPRFAGLTLDSAYHTKSMCLLMRSALSVYAKLNGMQGYALVAENPGMPLDLKRLLSSEPSTSAESSASAARKKENIPFDGGK